MSKKKSLKKYAGPLVLFVVVVPAMWLTLSLSALAATTLSQIYYRYVEPITSSNMPMGGESFVTDTR